MNRARWFVMVAISCGGLVAPGAEFTSGSAQVALIELYTSEGCSSCPPAERWLGGLRNDPRLWREFVPVAWHVNYWDHLGWRDTFASPAFVERQRAIVRSWPRGQLYTPCFVRNGREWRERDLTPATEAMAGNLTATIDAEGRVEIDFEPTETTADFDVHVALLGGGITSRVRSGENAGRALAHEFVALVLEHAPLNASSDASSVHAELTLPVTRQTGIARVALAAWVTRRGALAPVQATGGWLN
jgi:hypothetical protein